MMPNTFIAGAQKSGTSTLCDALASHPHVLVSSPKEPIFFSKAANLARPQLYEACFRADTGIMPRTIIDGSNAYMVDPLAPVRIRDLLGKELQFIFSLREPVQRMVSGYWHQAKKGREHRSLKEALSFEGDFPEACVEEEEERLEHAVRRDLIKVTGYAYRHDDPLWHFRYFRNSLYSADLARYHAIFGAKRVTVLFFEDLISDPMATLDSVATFLQLDPAGFPVERDWHGNPTQLPRMSWLFEALRRLPGAHFLRRVPGYAAVSQRIVYRRPPSTDPELIERLRDLFAPEVVRLQAMVDRDLLEIWG